MVSTVVLCVTISFNELLRGWCFKDARWQITANLEIGTQDFKYYDTLVSWQKTVVEGFPV